MDYQFLSQTMLFSGESPEEIKEMLSCLGAVTRSYGKGEIIYHAGECVHSMGLVLSGNVQIESDDVWGNHSVLDDITPGFFFAETYASLSKEPLMVNVVSAAAKTEVLFLNIGRLLTTCTNSCTHHNRLIHNLFFISARKNLLLSRRIFHTTPKSIRGRLLSYLSAQSAAANSLDFTIPFNRQQLADYLNVDPLLGTNEDFEALCTAAQKYGIGIVLDGVFSHTGSDSRYFNREGRYGEGGAYRDPNSPYRCWYDFGPQYKDGYRSWWGFETLPEVDEETPSYVEFITGPGGVIDTWLRRGAAGFRLDVADELPDEFIEKVRAAVKRVSPEKFLLGEVWEDATTKFGFNKRRTYLLGKGLDSVMNYPFKNAVLDFVKGKPAEQAMTEILTICEHYPAPAMDTALNFLSTHDTERALTVIADEPANGRGREWQSGRCVTGDAYEEGLLRLRMAYAIIYTLPGVPCLYYGDEIGMQGYRDPFNRAFFCWDSHEERLRPVLAQLAQLRHSCEAFRTGELRVLRAQDGILHYQRVGEAETAEIIVNRSEHIIVEPLASGKHTEVNPMGFTIVVEENGHNPNHSYYDIQ